MWNRGRKKGLVSRALWAACTMAVCSAMVVGCPLAPLKVVDGNDGIVPKVDVLCNSVSCDLTAGAGNRNHPSGEVRGTVTVSNDNYNLYVTFAPADGFAVGVTHVDVTCSAPDDRGAPGQYQSQVDPGGIVVFPNTVTHTFPFGAVSGSDGCVLDVDCVKGIGQTVFIRAHAETFTEDGENGETGFGGFSNCIGTGASSNPFPSNGGSWFAYITYDVNCCGGGGGGGESCRTQTQGGWGTNPHGGNPGTIRDAIWDTAFPDGLVVGCATGNTITLETSADVANFLPTGGRARALTSSYVNPTGNTEAGVFAGQLIAATITIAADETIPDFSDCGGNSIAGMCYVDDASPLNGLTVGEIVAIANEVIGGCSTAYTPNQLSAALANINENFSDGIADLGFLSQCN